MIARQTIDKCNRDLDTIGHTARYRQVVHNEKCLLNISIRRGNTIAFEYGSPVELNESAVNALVEAVVSAFIAGTRTMNASAEYVKKANHWLGMGM